MISRFFSAVYKTVKLEVFFRNISIAQHGLFNPIEQSFPVLGADYYDREAGDLTGLDQCNSCEKLVHSAKSARHHNISLLIFRRHYFTHKEIIELEKLITVDVFVVELLKRQLNIKPY